MVINCPMLLFNRIFVSDVTAHCLSRILGSLLRNLLYLVSFMLSLPQVSEIKDLTV